MNHIKDLLLGLVLGLLSLVMIEGALRITGIQQPPKQETLSRGFDRSAQYLVPGEIEGSWETRMWSLERKPHTVIPPKGQRERVLMFGGSNTVNFGDRILKMTLNSKSPTGDPRYEVINLGRSGYGSERVSIVFEQALKRLDPDYVLIYCGHNEFIEAGFRQDLASQWSSKTMERTANVALSTNVFEGLRGVLGPGAPSGAAGHKSEPADWAWEYDKFNDTTYEQTLRYLDTYQKNIEFMVELAERRGVKVVLSTIIYNRFSMPNQSTAPAGMASADLATITELMTSVEALIDERLLPLFPEEGWQRVNNFDWDIGFRTSGEPTPMAMVHMADMQGQRKFEGPLEKINPKSPAAKYWEPKVGALLGSLDHLIARNPSASQREVVAQQLGFIEEVIAIQGDHPKAHFMRGILGYWVGSESIDVRQDLENAGAFDRAPRRGNTVINNLISEVAARHPETLFVDIDQEFTQQHPDGLVGWEYMMDQCHLGLEGRRRVMYHIGLALLKKWGPKNV